MSARFPLLLSAVACGTLASCTVFPENPQHDPYLQHGRPGDTVSHPDQQDIQKKRDEMKKRDEEKARLEAEKKLTDNPPEQKTETPANPDATPESKPKPKVEKKDYPFANPVPGKEGFVFSPYNNKVVDVRDIPSGQLVQDPTYPQSEKKYFRVP
ncbi:MAG TPA: hypothetical protein VIM57_04345 [Luteolibacter sp.]